MINSDDNAGNLDDLLERGNLFFGALDKACRSGKLHEQHEAILHFPDFFTQFPIPVLIDLGYLKLAELWKIGNNFIRQEILKTIKKCTLSHSKIKSIDRFSRRICVVLTSNDPIAKALTLRFLGHMCAAVHTQIEVCHSIQEALNSEVPEEFEAAAFAADRLCPFSPAFARTICIRISRLVHKHPSVASKLIRMYRHMHYDYETAERAMDECRKLILTRQRPVFVANVLKTMTILSLRSQVHTSAQIELLLSIASADPDGIVRDSAFENLWILAQRYDHFTLNDFEFVLRIAGTAVSVFPKCLPILRRLCKNFSITEAFSQMLLRTSGLATPESSEWLTVMKKEIQSGGESSYDASVVVVEVLQSLDEADTMVLQKKRMVYRDLLESIVSAIEHHAGACDNSKITNLAKSFLCMSLHSDSAADVPEMCLRLLRIEHRHPALLETILNLHARLPHIASLPQQELLDTLHHASDPVRVYYLATLITKLVHNLTDDPARAALISAQLQRLNGEQLYLFGQDSLCAENSTLAAVVFGDLQKRLAENGASANQHVVWLNVLANLSLAHSGLKQGDAASAVQFAKQAREAHEKLEAIDGPRIFQRQFLMLFSEFTAVANDILSHTASADASPSSLVALRDLNIRALQLSGQFGRLSRMNFDISLTSLSVLERWQAATRLLSEILVRVGHPPSAISDWKLGAILEQQASESQDHGPGHDMQSLLSIRDAASSQTVATGDLVSWLGLMMQQHLRIPSHFFVTQPNYTIELIVTPRWKRNEPLVVASFKRFVLNLEGIVTRQQQLLDAGGICRKAVQCRCLIWVTALESQTSLAGAEKTKYSMQDHRVSVVDSYFALSTIVQFPPVTMLEGDLAEIHIDIRMIDDDGIEWEVGPSIALPIQLRT
ncbi:uncharacterized protein BJ171DRAFT_492938 [Polychytrium aggregatum]|uniref:uncharacterized protein n=1 Tax=Polychytrium aggregatum TaxID=110093 RepID=UPI0022FF0B18|nr:uncharacterized protein BJ171DRAFT_492938 [Polychytrium aggregatum]KAI9207513.1 hypothetical protein BJ171DRAFT_492938 [Polychytrium aggregatum]